MDREQNGAARRTFLKRGLVAGTPVLMSLVGKPVLGNQCTVSGMYSGNVSGPDTVVCQGFTPGFWGEHPFEWPSPFYAGDCTTTQTGKHCFQKDYLGGTAFHDYFAGDLFVDGTRSLTIMEVIQLQGGNNQLLSSTTGGRGRGGGNNGLRDQYQAGAHAAAALLNATHFRNLGTPEVFGYLPEDITEMWNAQHATNLEGLKEVFQLLNERGG